MKNAMTTDDIGIDRIARLICNISKLHGEMTESKVFAVQQCIELKIWHILHTTVCIAFLSMLRLQTIMPIYYQHLLLARLSWFGCTRNKLVEKKCSQISWVLEAYNIGQTVGHNIIGLCNINGLEAASLFLSNE